MLLEISESGMHLASGAGQPGDSRPVLLARRWHSGSKATSASFRSLIVAGVLAARGGRGERVLLL